MTFNKILQIFMVSHQGLGCVEELNEIMVEDLHILGKFT